MRLAVRLCGIAAVSVAVAGGTAAPASGQRHEPVPQLPKPPAASACAVAFDEQAFSEASSEGQVKIGDPLSIDVTWSRDWKEGAMVEVLACTAVNGVFRDDVSDWEPAVENDGLFVHDFVVPVDVAASDTICERTIVIGQSPSGAAKAERSDADCFTVAAAPQGSDQPLATELPMQSGSQSPGPPAAAANRASPGLPRTGPGDDVLALAAGLLLVLGGFGVAFGTSGAICSRGARSKPF